jgi:hypothetical protein
MDTVGSFVDSGWWTVLTSLIATASLAAAITPNKWDGMLLSFLRDVLDLVALNFGNAKPEGKSKK